MTRAAESHWELPARSGRESSRWTVKGQTQDSGDVAYKCDVDLRGRYFGETLDPSSAPLSDYRLTLRGLYLGENKLRRLVGYLDEWLQLPAAEQVGSRLEISCGLGHLFDQSLRLILGQRNDTLSDGSPVATLEFVVGRLSGELSYLVDPACLKTFRDGISAVLNRGCLQGST